MLDEPDAVSAGGQALDLTDRAFVTHFPQPGVPGVDQCQGISTHHCATGKTTVTVEVVAGCQCNGQMLPMDQIGTFGMPPIHRAPFRFERVVLIEHMVFATKVHHPVGVVHPAHGGGKMIIGSIIVDDTRQAITQRMLRNLKGSGHWNTHGIQRHSHRAPARAERRGTPGRVSMACGWRFKAVPSASNRCSLSTSSCSSTRSPACHPALTSQRQISGSS
ncbi:hypothetical protein D3C71_1204260 [compost metagenome]